jgi:hypothetical protein
VAGVDKLPHEIKKAYIKTAIDEIWLSLSAVITMILLMIPFIN